MMSVPGSGCGWVGGSVPYVHGKRVVVVAGRCDGAKCNQSTKRIIAATVDLDWYARRLPAAASSHRATACTHA